MEEVDLGVAAPPQAERGYESDGSSVGNQSEDDGHNADQTQQEGLSQRLRGSLQRRVSPLYDLRNSLVASTGSVDTSALKASGGAAAEKLRTAVQRIRGRSGDNQADAEPLTDDEQGSVQAGTNLLLRSTLASSGLKIHHEDHLVLLGHTPLVQPQDDLLFLEQASASTWTVKRGDFVRIQSPDDDSQSWLCQVSLTRYCSDAGVLPLALPFPGPLVPDAIVHLVPRECLPKELRSDVDDSSSSSEDEHLGELRSSVDAWRPGADDPADSTDDEYSCMAEGGRYSGSLTSEEYSAASRTSAARDKAAALYQNLKSRKARLRTSSSDYKEKLAAAGQASKQKLAAAGQASKQKLAAAGQASKQKLAVASQVSKEKMAVAGQVSKEKLAVASQVSKEKLAVASQVSKEKLAVAGQVSKEKLAVAGQVSKEKLAVAGQASKLRMQSWTNSARSSFKAKLGHRSDHKAASTTPLMEQAASPDSANLRVTADEVAALLWSTEAPVDAMNERRMTLDC